MVRTAACTTSTHGTCSLGFPASFSVGGHAARATKKGYGSATTRLRVR